MALQTLNASVIETLPNPNQGQKLYFDAKLKGFGVRVTQNAKTYICEARVKGRKRRVSIAPVGTLTVNEARKEAQKQLGLMATNVDVNRQKAEERARGITLSEAKKRFFEKRKLREKTRYDYERVFCTNFSDWNKKPLKDISPNAFLKRFRKLKVENGQATANKAMRVFRSVWNFNRDTLLGPDGSRTLPECPIQTVKAEKIYKEVERRDTALDDDALPRWFQSLQDLNTSAHKAAGENFKDYAELLLRTGLRRPEGASLRWEDVDLGAKELTVRQTKNGTDHTLPMSRQIVAILLRRHTDLKSGFVFASKGASGYLGDPRKYQMQSRRAVGHNWTWHDLRRTFSTTAVRCKVNSYALKRLLNHSRKQRDVTDGYIVLTAGMLSANMQDISDEIDRLAKLGKGG